MGERLFTDAHGVEWEVFDESDWSLGLALAFDRPHVTSDPGLLFISTEGIRRLRRRPENWRALSDAELEVLCRSAVPLV